jgi:hypothetical protein
VGGVTYDTGALVAAERNNRTMWKVHSGLLDEGVVPVIPAAVLAQAWRGGARQANLARMLQMCRVEAMSEQLAKSIGVLVGQTGHDDVVDAAVVEGAIRRGDAVVTSDASHIRKVATAAGHTLRIQSV